MEFETEKDPKNLELVLVTSSLNHEYAKREHDKARTFHKREALLQRMSHMKLLYFNAREVLAESDPLRLAQVEEELRLQKQTVFPEHIV